MKSQLTKDIRFILVGINHSLWCRCNPDSTLADLLGHLRSVEEELSQYDEDALIADYIDELGDAGDYLRTFEEPIETVSVDGDLLTFGLRCAYLEEDIERVVDLVEIVGESFPVSQLPLGAPPAEATAQRSQERSAL